MININYTRPFYVFMLGNHVYFSPVMLSDPKIAANYPQWVSIFRRSILWSDKFNKMIIIYELEMPLLADVDLEY